MGFAIVQVKGRIFACRGAYGSEPFPKLKSVGFNGLVFHNPLSNDEKCFGCSLSSVHSTTDDQIQNGQVRAKNTTWQ